MTRDDGGGAAVEHAPEEFLLRYADRDPDLPADMVWAVESHLETCARCRARLGATVRAHSPGADALLERLQLVLDDQRPHVAPAPAPRRRARWAPPTLIPWLVMTVAVLVMAVALDGAWREFRATPLLLLIAPIAPLIGVSAAWSRALDPAFELTAATPRAGWEMVLRRTLVVLAVVMPTLALGGIVVGVSAALWLVPCLAFTFGVLALGQVFGLARAAMGLGVAWAAVIVAPTLATSELSGALAPASMPVWAVAAVVAVGVLVLRRRTLTQLTSGR